MEVLVYSLSIQLMEHELLHMHQHLVKTLELQAVDLHKAENRQSSPEDHLDSSQEEKVQDRVDSLIWHPCYEQLHKPGKGEHLNVEVDSLKVLG